MIQYLESCLSHIFLVPVGFRPWMSRTMDAFRACSFETLEKFSPFAAEFLYKLTAHDASPSTCASARRLLCHCVRPADRGPVQLPVPHTCGCREPPKRLHKVWLAPGMAESHTRKVLSVLQPLQVRPLPAWPDYGRILPTCM
jgi:hypothetical protein